MVIETSIQLCLKQFFLEAKAKNPAFSLRSFARKIGLSPSATSRVLNGKRGLSKQKSHQILDRLGLGPEQKQEILSLGLVKKGKDQDPSRIFLSADQFELITESKHFTLLSLLKTKGFKPDPAWISVRLGLPLRETQETIARLVRLGLLKVTGKKWIGTGKRIETPDSISNPAIRNLHLSDLSLKQSVLETKGVEERDFTALTLAFDPNRMAEARTMIRTFEDDFFEKFGKGKRTEVYKLCVQLIPVTQLKTNERKK
jgi:uncharacterized protein (TIGR02147 family)